MLLFHRTVPQRPAVRAAAVPAGGRADAGLRHHGPRQPGARLALHDRRLFRRDLRGADRQLRRRRRCWRWSPRWWSAWRVEVIAMRRLYGRDHLDHVLGTFGLHPVLQRAGAADLGAGGHDAAAAGRGSTRGRDAARRLLSDSTASSSSSSRSLVALLLYVLVMRTRIGMLIRAGASNREMIGALGINIKLLYTLVFGLGAALAGLAGLMQAPILTVQIGMGENILILAFVVIIIGGIGSIRGAFVAVDLRRADRHHRPRLPARPAAAVPEPSAASSAGAGAVVDADLPADGGRAGVAAGRPVPGGRANDRLAHTAQRRRRRADRDAGAGAGLCAR